MWLVLQLIAILCITFVHTFNRWAGINNIGFMVVWPVNITMQAIIAPLFIFSYKLAPSFFQAWFIGTLAICFFGFIVSLFIFGEVLTLKYIIGVIFAVISMILLV